MQSLDAGVFDRKSSGIWPINLQEALKILPPAPEPTTTYAPEALVEVIPNQPTINDNPVLGPHIT